jgi:hypothetical protein
LGRPQRCQAGKPDLPLLIPGFGQIGENDGRGFFPQDCRTLGEFLMQL